MTHISYAFATWARDLKSLGKYGLEVVSKLSMGLNYGLSFRIQAAS